MVEIGRTFNVRTIVPSDAQKYRNILQRTSAEDRYCRFFHSVDTFDDNAIEQYVGTRSDTVGLIAEKNGLPLGAGHAFYIGEGQAEIALLVAHDAQRLGVGRRLLSGLVAALRQRECGSVVAYALAQNGAFSKLAAAAGMRPGASDGAVVPWTLSLAAETIGRNRRATTRASAAAFDMNASDHSITVAGVALRSYYRLLILTQELLATSQAPRRPAASFAVSTLEQANSMQHRCTRLLRASLTGLESASFDYSIAAGNAVTLVLAAAYESAGTIVKGPFRLINRRDETIRQRPAA